jgi:hypothetical protein
MKKTFLLTAMILFTGMIPLFAQSHGADQGFRKMGYCHSKRW